MEAADNFYNALTSGVSTGFGVLLTRVIFKYQFLHRPICIMNTHFTVQACDRAIIFQLEFN